VRNNTLSENPLLSISFEVPFDRILPEHVAPAVEALLEKATKNLEAIEQVSGARTYANTLHPLDHATEALEIAMGVVGHLESVANTQELRDAYNSVRPEVSAFYAGIPLRAGLWAALQDFAASDDAKALRGPRARYLDKTLEEFRRSGAELADEGKERLQAISRELAELTSRFSQNVLDDTAKYELVIDDQTRLAGLPTAAIEAARHAAKEKGLEGYRFTLHAPSLVPVLTYLDDRDIREQLWRAYNSRASGGDNDNRDIIESVLRLRREQAKLLGYEEFAALVLEDRMAHDTRTAQAFIEQLHDKTTPFFEQETRALHKFAKQHLGSYETLEPWDVGYASEKQRKALYDFDEEALRPYFPINGVIDGLFETANRLYGVAITPNSKLPTWHSDVRAFDIVDASGEHLASFYADLYPRQEKRGGAWMNSFITGTLRGSKLSPHLALICTNVTPPLGERPALLSHGEVTTLFHEFGHLLHHCLSRVEVRTLAGTNVAWDFVELPSQIMENWCWERAALNTFARHYETREEIPEDLFQKMRRARAYRAASATMRQLGFAAVDLALHVRYDGSSNVLDYARDIMQAYAPTPYPKEYAMLASFLHLFSSSVGYAAGYYSYKWAEVLDADAFTRFQGEDIFSRDIGDKFRRCVLEKGNSEDPMDLYKAFMGREPSLDALMERSGLTTAATPPA
jgi:oligopeptidase A